MCEAAVPFDIEVRELATEAVALIEGLLSDFTSGPSFLNRHLSAGFLACCATLLRGIALLEGEDHGHPAVQEVFYSISDQKAGPISITKLRLLEPR